MMANKQKNHKKYNFKSIDLEIKQIFPDIDEWPESWAGFKNDIPIGKVILEKFKLFLYEQKDRISKKTFKDYGNYLWALGGEIIRDTNENEIKIKDLNEKFLFNYVDECGGPYWRHANNEQDHDRYDSICRRFYKYLLKK
jgi:hypothetical protein